MKEIFFLIIFILFLLKLCNILASVFGRYIPHLGGSYGYGLLLQGASGHYQRYYTNRVNFMSGIMQNDPSAK